MHVYQDGSVETEAVRAYAVPSGGGQTSAIDLGRGVRVHLHTAADCVALIAAAVEAKRLLDPPDSTPIEEWPEPQAAGQ